MGKSFLGLSRDNLLILVSMLLWGSGEGLWYYVQPLYIKSLGADSLEIGLVMSLGPVLWATGSGADVMRRIAAPMVGGVVTSFVGGLLVFPAMYFIWRSLPLTKSPLYDNANSSFFF